jgi:hypothetical protein
VKLNLEYENSAGRLLAILQKIGKKGTYTDLLPRLFFPEEKNTNKGNNLFLFKLTIRALGELHILYNQFLKDS